CDILAKRGLKREHQLVRTAHARLEETGFYNWDGGTTIYTVYLQIPSAEFAELLDSVRDIERAIASASEPLQNLYSQTWFSFELAPSMIDQVDKRKLLQNIDLQKSLMIAVATGGPKIE